MNFHFAKITPGFWLLVFCASMYYLTMGGHLYSADNEIKGLIAEAIVKRQAFTLPVSDMAYMTPGRGGLSFSPFPLGSSITMIPSFLLGDWLAALFSGISRPLIIEFCYSIINSLCTAVTCLILYGICGLLGYRLPTCLATALIFGFCTIAWPYAKTTWSEPQAALCVLSGLYCLLRFNTSRKYVWLCLGGIAVGYGILTKLEMLIYAGLLSCLLLYYLLRTKPRTWQKVFSGLMAWSIPISLFGLAVLCYNYIRFEQWFAFSHYTASVSAQLSQGSSVWLDSLEGIVVGTYQHLFSTGKGILLFSPPLIMYYWAIKVFWKSHRAEALFCLALPIMFLLMAGSSWIMTKISWGERYFVTLTPFLILPLSALISDIIERRSTYMRKSLFTFIGLGLCVQMLGISINFQTVVDKMGAAGEKVDIQSLSYDPEYSPVLLHAQEFYGRMFDTWDLMVDGPEAFMQAQQTAAGQTAALNLNIKSNRDIIRFYTFDYWFCYMYLMQLPLLMILFPGLILVTTAIVSGKRLVGYFSVS